MTNQIETLKTKLKSATKLKLKMERHVSQANSREQSLIVRTATLMEQTEHIKENIEESKKKMIQMGYQKLMTKTCAASENSNISALIDNFDNHLAGYQQLYDKVRDYNNIRKKEMQVKEAEEAELQRQKEMEIAQIHEEEEKAIAAAKAECAALEKECTVLQKRNNAIMLQLRRKLLETENARRELAKKVTTNETFSDETKR